MCLAQLWEKSAILGNGVWFTANFGELSELWESAYLEESAQLCVCVLHYYYIQIYINLYLVISPSRAPPLHIYLWNIFRRPTNVLASLVTSPHLDYMWRLLSAYKTKPVINMIIKRNVKNKSIIFIPAIWIRLCRTRALCLLPEIWACAHKIWDWGGWGGC